MVRRFCTSPNESAYKQLEKYVISYFRCSQTVEDGKKTHTTCLYPIFLQRPGSDNSLIPNNVAGLTPKLGHSMTIVGVEFCEENEVKLLVFDPDRQSSLSGIKYLGSHNRQRLTKSFLARYQRDRLSLEQYDELETLV